MGEKKRKEKTPWKRDEKLKIAEIIINTGAILLAAYMGAQVAASMIVNNFNKIDCVLPQNIDTGELNTGKP